MWNTATEQNRYYLLYNPDPQAPGTPQRQMPGQVDTAVQTETMIADQEIHDTTGLQLASLGKKSNEKSGIAIEARQREGDMANFAFTNNLNRAQKYSAKVILDLIPKIYDNARMIRILGPDGAEKLVAINQAYRDEKTGEETNYMLNVGKYDVVAALGPSYQTQRRQAQAGMVELVRNLPNQAPLIMDLVAENLDWPGANKFAERFKKTLPPELRDEQDQKPNPQQQMQMAAQQEAMEMQKQMAMVAFEKERILLEQEQKKLEGIGIENEIKRIELAAKMQGMEHEEESLEIEKHKVAMETHSHIMEMSKPDVQPGYSE
jgi:23S rRNA pseudoU1915 N3-methylase RlmH